MLVSPQLANNNNNKTGRERGNVISTEESTMANFYYKEKNGSYTNKHKAKNIVFNG